ncbi:MAG: DNA polymerase/3'-5' exonuclease PolX [Candidatus Omnitrophota bacterium]
MNNTQIADIFDKIADILELKGENPFKIRAYRRGAVSIRSMPQEVSEFAKSNPLTSLPGIGKDLSEKITELINTHSLKYYEDLKKATPAGLLDIMTIPGVGPKTTKLLYDSLNIDSIEKLKKHAQQHKLSKLPHLKEKTEQNILEGISFLEKSSGRMLLANAVSAAESAIDYLKKAAPGAVFSAAGSTRRMKDTIRDIDILAASKKPKTVMDAFVHMPHVDKISSSGETKSSILTKENIQIDMRVVDPSSYGAALVYFTGSKEHNVGLRHLAMKRGLKINEYGVFKHNTNKRIAGKTEQEVYKSVGLEFIPPELRENRGEIEAAAKAKLPKLIEAKDIKGDLHAHSDYSDGKHKLQDIAQYCKEIGYEYIAITDHSKSLKITGGLSEEALAKKNKEIDALNKKIKGIKILKGAEVDIDSQGQLDYSDDILKDMDVVIAAIHTSFKQPKDIMTKRILKAMDNKYVHIIAHPTGRLLNTREACQVDLNAVIKHAKDTKTAIEINGNPQRLDLDDIHAKQAAEIGVKIVLTTDMHRLEQFEYMRFCVSVARRAWLTKACVLNTLSASAFLQALRK